MALAFSTAKSRSASVGTTPDSDTTPLLVSTLISRPLMLSSARKLDFTLLVIQVSDTASSACSILSPAARTIGALVVSAKATGAMERLMAEAAKAARVNLLRVFIIVSPDYPDVRGIVPPQVGINIASRVPNH